MKSKKCGPHLIGLVALKEFMHTHEGKTYSEKLAIRKLGKVVSHQNVTTLAF